jgi:hypothetical protein
LIAAFERILASDGLLSFHTFGPELAFVAFALEVRGEPKLTDAASLMNIGITKLYGISSAIGVYLGDGTQ